MSAASESGAPVRVVPGAGLDWNSTSRDYLTHRPGYPDSFFRLVELVGVGLPGQHILDLGTGTGALAVPFARAGAQVVGVDASEAQLSAAREAAEREGLTIDLRFARAEDTGIPGGSFDAITASMCWGYFETARMVEEVPRLLRRDGVLVIASIIWVRGGGEVARTTDELIARYNEASAVNPRGGPLDPLPAWSVERFKLRTYHTYVEPLVFSRASWRGRIRASKWIGAALHAERVAAFDRELDEALRQLGGSPFEVPHRITFQVFEPRHAI
ncbi:MAG: class I SAM-dependent methyltransferase [Pseudomonadota bacterium]